MKWNGLNFLAAIFCIASFSQAVSDQNYRLNSLVYPSEYEVVITPYFNTGDSLAFTFDGQVKIAVKTDGNNVNQIKMHSEDLQFSAENVTVTQGQSSVQLDSNNPLEFDTKYHFVYINLATQLDPNSIYYINIVYRGPIRNDLNGFYRSSYIENGVTKWLGATQMEPVHTRKVFPCFDEPQYKATFTLTIDRPEYFRPTVANTQMLSSINLTNGFIRETFYPTPTMSSYLVAFLVSEFEAVRQKINGGKELSIYVRPEAANQSDYAFDFGVRVVDALSEYLGIDYYSVDAHLKLDHAALPDFRAGAMENWGLVKYREALLMYAPTESTPYYKYRVAQIIAHETTHMWFGNLVTCHWWSDTWLNEGFANYFENRITADVEPELGSWDISVTSSVYTAYSADELPDAHPISYNDVNSPPEISAHFGAMSYQKAGSVIRMIHHWIGDDAFKLGLNKHLNASRLSVVVPKNVYDSLQEGIEATGALASYPNSSIAEVMSSWIVQAGYPVVHVDADVSSGLISLRQERFYLNETFESSEIYHIPITYATAEDPDFNDTKPDFVMTTKVHEFNVTDLGDNWIIFNKQETGFYRVNYDTASWRRIAEGLNGGNRTKIHRLNRAKIINDIFAFANAGMVKYDLLYEVTKFLSEETEYTVWYAALIGINSIRSKLTSVGEASIIDTYTLRLMENVINDLGFDVRDTDEFVTLRNRMQIMEHICKIGHEGCINHTINLFKEFKEKQLPVPTSLRPVTYCTALRHGDSEDFDFLWNQLLTTNVANDALEIQKALGCSKSDEKLRSYLTETLSDNLIVRTQDLTVPIQSVISSNSQLALDFVKENYLTLANRTTIATVLAYFPSAFDDVEELEEFEEWLNQCESCTDDVIQSTRTAILTAKQSHQWTMEHLNEIISPIRQNNGLTEKPTFLVLLVAMCLLLVLK